MKKEERPCLTQFYAIGSENKTEVAFGAELHAFLTSALDGSE
jgi:hypothetical protein